MFVLLCVCVCVFIDINMDIDMYMYICIYMHIYINKWIYVLDVDLYGHSVRPVVTRRRI